jgi:alkylation response protein AidB-like acyl-CoA dehydrogenase
MAAPNFVDQCRSFVRRRQRTSPTYFSSDISSLILLEAGDEDQKARFLASISRGEETLTLALTESGHSWEPEAVKTTARAENGNFVLNGLKLFVHDAQASTYFIVPARTADGYNPLKSISLFLVPSKSKGVSVRRLPGFFAGRNFEVKLDSVVVSPKICLERSTMDGNILRMYREIHPSLVCL